MSDKEPTPDLVFDGGSMDCGSGLILLIRQNMLKVPSGGVLEIRSTEPTVEGELPPWCRMVGHQHLQSVQTEPGHWKHWIRRGGNDDSEKTELEADKKKAKDFKWSLRARRTPEQKTNIYSRNFSWQSGNSVDFDRKGELPSSLEQLFGALLADVIHCFSIRCSRCKILIDELEGTASGTLNDTLAAAGIAPGDSSVKAIKLALFVTSPAPSTDIKMQWELALHDAPVYQTLRKSCEIDSRIVLL